MFGLEFPPLFNSDAFYSLGTYHPILVHYPVVFTVILFCCDVLALLRIGKTQRVGSWFCVLAALSFIPTLLTGWFAGENYVRDPFFTSHRFFAFLSFSLMALYAILRGCELKNIRKPMLGWNFTVSLVLVLLVGMTADFGGILTRGKTPFTMREEIEFEDLQL